MGRGGPSGAKCMANPHSHPKLVGAAPQPPPGTAPPALVPVELLSIFTPPSVDHLLPGPPGKTLTLQAKILWWLLILLKVKPCAFETLLRLASHQPVEPTHTSTPHSSPPPTHMWLSPKLPLSSTLSPIPSGCIVFKRLVPTPRPNCPHPSAFPPHSPSPQYSPITLFHVSTLSPPLIACTAHRHHPYPPPTAPLPPSLSPCLPALRTSQPRVLACPLPTSSSQQLVFPCPLYLPCPSGPQCTPNCVPVSSLPRSFAPPRTRLPCPPSSVLPTSSYPRAPAQRPSPSASRSSTPLQTLQPGIRVLLPAHPGFPRPCAAWVGAPRWMRARCVETSAGHTLTRRPASRAADWLPAGWRGRDWLPPRAGRARFTVGSTAAWMLLDPAAAPRSVEPERRGGAGRGHRRSLSAAHPGPAAKGSLGSWPQSVASGGGQRAMRGSGMQRGARGSRGPQRRR